MQLLNEFIKTGYEEVGRMGGSAIPTAIEPQEPSTPGIEPTTPEVNVKAFSPS